MATPGIPNTFNVQTANGQNFLSWALMPGATIYSVQRSTDGVTYTSVAAPTTAFYLDTAVSIGTTYYYQVAASDGILSSSYTLPQSVVPVPNGEMCLAQIRLQAQQRADRVNSSFVSLTEWNTYINQSLFELYDLLITAYGEEYFAAPALIFLTNGTDQLYPLPDGTNLNKALAFYKLLGVDLGLNAGPQQSNNGWVTINKFNFIDRNKYFYPNTQSTIYGVFNMQYRLFGNQIEFIPTPSGNQPIRMWYIPRMTMLLQDNDITTSGVSGWMEYVIVDAAIKALQKEESDVGVLGQQKSALLMRITATSMNRDAGQPDTISDTRGNGPSGGWGGGAGNGFGAGW